MNDVIVKESKDPTKNGPPYHYTECGLNNVYLCCGYSEEVYDGERHFAVHEVYKLHREIGRVIASKKSVPSSKEVRFLRNEMNLTQQELGTLLGVDSQTVARYEKVGQSDISGPAERLLRAFYLNHIDEKVDIVEFVEWLAELDETTDTDIEFSFDDGGEWTSTQVACG